MVDSITIDKKHENNVNALVVNVKGKPHENINLQVKLNQLIPINNGEFTLEVKDVSVPWSHNRLTIDAFGVEKITLAVKFFLWIKRTIEGYKGHASYTLENVPRGDYDIRISGKAMTDSTDVDLSISASAAAILDHRGTMTYVYSIENIIEGMFKVNVGDKEEKIEITREDNSTGKVGVASP